MKTCFLFGHADCPEDISHGKALKGLLERYFG